jgi:hypothetical protein
MPSARLSSPQSHAKGSGLTLSAAEWVNFSCLVYQRSLDYIREGLSSLNLITKYRNSHYYRRIGIAYFTYLSAHAASRVH